MLLQRGAVRVVALDVGHGQLDWKLRNDERVVVIEHFNARHLTLADLPTAVDIVTIDVSFISLRQIFPVVTPVLRPGADIVALVKPQFEAGRTEVRKGIIRDPAIHSRVLEEVTAAGAEVGLSRVASTPSPITGQKGNVEFLVHFRPVMSGEITRIGIVAKSGLARGCRSSRSARVVAARSQHRADLRHRHAASWRQAAGETRSRDELPSDVDLVVVMGGDGTLLSMATRTAQAGRDMPILGVNFGSLGFLTEARIDELYDVLESVLNGTATFDERAMLAADAYRAREHFDSRIVLNDVVFTKAALSRIIELSVSVGAGLVTKVKADGLIVATATGSTAYNLAAGGPIVHPRADAIVLTPIAPHTLTNRPIVIPGSEVIEIRPQVVSGVEDIYVTYDGQTGYPLQQNDVVRVRRSERTLRLVKAPARSYFEVLREKLKWGERGGRE